MNNQSIKEVEEDLQSLRNKWIAKGETESFVEGVSRYAKLISSLQSSAPQNSSAGVVKALEDWQTFDARTDGSAKAAQLYFQGRKALEEYKNQSSSVVNISDEEIEAMAKEIMVKYVPNGAINLKAKGAGNGKPQYKYEKKVLTEMIIEGAKAIRDKLQSSVKDEDKGYKESQDELWNDIALIGVPSMKAISIMKEHFTISRKSKPLKDEVDKEQDKK